MKWIIRIFALILLALVLGRTPAGAQRSGPGLFTGSSVCSDVTSQVTNGTWCLDSTSGYLFVWTGSSWLQIAVSSTQTHVASGTTPALTCTQGAAQDLWTQTLAASTTPALPSAAAANACSSPQIVYWATQSAGNSFTIGNFTAGAGATVVYDSNGGVLKQIVTAPASAAQARYTITWDSINSIWHVVLQTENPSQELTSQPVATNANAPAFSTGPNPVTQGNAGDLNVYEVANPDAGFVNLGNVSGNPHGLAFLGLTGGSGADNHYHLFGGAPDVTGYSSELDLPGGLRPGGPIIPGQQATATLWSYVNLLKSGLPAVGGFWRMGEASGNLTDSSGNANTATAVGACTYAQTAPFVDDPTTAISCNGTNANYFTVPTSGTLPSGDTLSLNFWVKVNSLSAANLAIFGQTSVSASHPGLQAFLNCNGTTCFASFNAWDGTTNTLVARSTSSAFADTITYHNIGYVKSAVTSTVYVDGKASTTTGSNVTLAPTNAAADLFNAPGVTTATNVTMGNLAVWQGQALTAQQMMAIYQQGITNKAYALQYDKQLGVMNTWSAKTGTYAGLWFYWSGNGNAVAPSNTVASFFPANGTATPVAAATLGDVQTQAPAPVMYAHNLTCQLTNAAGALTVAGGTNWVMALATGSTPTATALTCTILAGLSGCQYTDPPVVINTANLGAGSLLSFAMTPTGTPTALVPHCSFEFTF